VTIGQPLLMQYPGPYPRENQPWSNTAEIIPPADNGQSSIWILFQQLPIFALNNRGTTDVPNQYTYLRVYSQILYPITSAAHASLTSSQSLCMGIETLPTHFNPDY